MYIQGDSQSMVLTTCPICKNAFIRFLQFLKFISWLEDDISKKVYKYFLYDHSEGTS